MAPQEKQRFEENEYIDLPETFTLLGTKREETETTVPIERNDEAQAQQLRILLVEALTNTRMLQQELLKQQLLTPAVRVPDDLCPLFVADADPRLIDAALVSVLYRQMVAQPNWNPQRAMLMLHLECQKGLRRAIAENFDTMNVHSNEFIVEEEGIRERGAMSRATSSSSPCTRSYPQDERSYPFDQATMFRQVHGRGYQLDSHPGPRWEDLEGIFPQNHGSPGSRVRHMFPAPVPGYRSLVANMPSSVPARRLSKHHLLAQQIRLNSVLLLREQRKERLSKSKYCGGDYEISSSRTTQITV